MTPLPQRSVPSVAADGRSGSTSTRMPTTAGSTRRTWLGRGDTRDGSRRRSTSRGAASPIPGRPTPSRATAIQASTGHMPTTSPRIMPEPAGRPGATSGPGRVLGLVVLAERARLDRLPPRLVGAIPLHRRGERGVEARGRGPAEGGDLGRVERVAAIVPGSVGDRLDEAHRLAEQREDPVGQGDVLHLGPPPDVFDSRPPPPAEAPIQRGAAF